MYFIFFVTYKWAEKASVTLQYTGKGLPVTNTLADWSHAPDTKKMECGEHDQKTTLRPRYLTGFLMMEHDYINAEEKTKVVL
jgi:hypothetical protein